MKNRVLENVGALEKGVLILDCDIEKELAKLSPSDARVAKRKYRKLLRRVNKEYFNLFGKKITCKKVALRRVRQLLRKTGAEKLQRL